MAKFRSNFIKIWAKITEKNSKITNFRKNMPAKNVKKCDENFLKYWGLSGAKACKSCRSRQELSNELDRSSNEDLLAKIGVDTAENEPLRDWLKIGQYLLLDAGTQYSITKRNLPYNSSTDLQKVCNILQDLVEIFCNLFWQTLKFSRIFQEFFKNFQRLFFKNSAAWWSLLVVANFQIHDWKFSDFSHFWEKKLLKFFDFKLSIMWGPFMQNNISWRPQNKWGPPGLARWRWDLVHFREFFRIFGKILATFLGAKRPGRHKLGTSAEQDRSHRVRCFEKKVTDP